MPIVGGSSGDAGRMSRSSWVRTSSPQSYGRPRGNILISASCQRKKRRLWIRREFQHLLKANSKQSSDCCGRAISYPQPHYLWRMPYNSDCCSKSLSLETIPYPPSTAKAQTSESAAEARLNQRTCADSGYSTSNRPGSRGDRFWSKRSLTRLVPLAVAAPDQPRKRSKLGYPLP